MTGTRNITPAIINQAAECADLDDACLVIQNAANITDGGVASLYFSGTDEDEWADMPPALRAIKLREYVEMEATYESED